MSTVKCILEWKPNILVFRTSYLLITKFHKVEHTWRDQFSSKLCYTFFESLLYVRSLSYFRNDFIICYVTVCQSLWSSVWHPPPKQIFWFCVNYDLWLPWTVGQENWTCKMFITRIPYSCSRNTCYYSGNQKFSIIKFRFPY